MSDVREVRAARPWILGVLGNFDRSGLHITGIPARSALRDAHYEPDHRGRRVEIETGDHIQAIGGDPIRNLDDYLNALASAPDPRNVVLLVKDRRSGAREDVPADHVVDHVVGIVRS